MKKFVKWFVFWTLVLGGLSIAICYMVIPQRTKEAFDIVVGYLNTPIFIASGTVVTLGMVFGIIVKLVYDRHREKTISEIKDIQGEIKKQSEHYENIIKDQHEKIIAYCNELEDKEQKLEELEKYVVETLKVIPNKKVQERLEKLYVREETTND